MPVEIDLLLKQIDLLLDACAEPALILHRPYPSQNIALGRSRFGGTPTMPLDVEWPIGTYWPYQPVRNSEGKVIPIDAPMTFVCQVDCAEIHKYDDRFPSQGMLFFFASLAGEQYWNDPSASRSSFAKVVFCEEVDPEEPERPVPPNLPFVLDNEFDQAPWLPLDESGVGTYPASPMIIKPILSWPDDAAMINYSDRISTIQKFWPNGEVPNTFLDAGWEELIKSYRHRRDWRRAASIMPAIEAVDSIIPPVRYAGTEHDMLSCWGALRFIARSIATFCDRVIKNNNKREELIPVLNELKDGVGHWLNAMNQAPDSQRLTLDEKFEFLRWINGFRDDKRFNFSESIDGIRVQGLLDKAIKIGARAAAIRGFGPSRYPDQPLVRGIASGPFHISDNDLGLDKSRSSIGVHLHQMLGHFPTRENQSSEESSAIGLLNLYSDYGLDFMFHDCMNLQFWITAEDLTLRRFDMAWATIG